MSRVVTLYPGTKEWRYRDRPDLLAQRHVMTDGGCLDLIALNPEILNTKLLEEREEALQKKLVDETNVICILPSGRWGKDGYCH